RDSSDDPVPDLDGVAGGAERLERLRRVPLLRVVERHARFLEVLLADLDPGLAVRKLRGEGLALHVEGRAVEDRARAELRLAGLEEDIGQAPGPVRVVREPARGEPDVPPRG